MGRPSARGRWREHRPGAVNLCRRWHVRHSLLVSMKCRVPKLLIVSESHQNVAGMAGRYEDHVTAAGWYSGPLPPPLPSSFLFCPFWSCPSLSYLLFSLLFQTLAQTGFILVCPVVSYVLCSLWEVPRQEESFGRWRAVETRHLILMPAVPGGFVTMSWMEAR